MIYGFLNVFTSMLYHLTLKGGPLSTARITALQKQRSLKQQQQQQLSSSPPGSPHEGKVNTLQSSTSTSAPFATGSQITDVIKTPVDEHYWRFLEV